MSDIRLRVVVETDGEVCIRNLPCRKGDWVETIVILPDSPTRGDPQTAKARFIERAQSSGLCSPGGYPTRDQLHERN